MQVRQSDEGKTEHEPCLVHWARFNISVDGYALVCFNELFKKEVDPRLIYGDVNQRSIADIWHGMMLTELRQAALHNNYEKLPFADALPCGKCTYCQPLYGKRQTSEHQIRQLPEAKK